VMLINYRGKRARLHSPLVLFVLYVDDFAAAAAAAAAAPPAASSKMANAGLVKEALQNKPKYSICPPLRLFRPRPFLTFPFDAAIHTYLQLFSVC
jgi:hypothetical protein